MMIGYFTLSMKMLLKSMPAALLGPDAGHVLILIPFVVPTIVQFLTLTPVTSSSFGSFPRLPTLLNQTKSVSYSSGN